jgi:hypothetical protein
MREIILRFEMNLYSLILSWQLKFISVFSSKYRSIYLLGCGDPRELLCNFWLIICRSIMVMVINPYSFK